MSLALFSFFIIGAVAGALSGLLGLGGGIFVVPALAFVFKVHDMPPDIIMHMAAGTSLAVMIITTIRALLSHLKYKIEFWPVYRLLLPGVIVGVIGGAILAHSLRSHTLSIVFGIFVLLMAAKMFFVGHETIKQIPLNKKAMSFSGIIIGFLSGLLGLGGGSITIPLLTTFNVPMRTTIVISIAICFVVAIIGSVSFALIGLHTAGLPAWSTGYIYWPALIPFSLGSIIFASLGTWASHRLPVHVLQKIFAVFLFAIGIYMLL